MKFTELKKSLEEGRKSIYLIEGEDAYFRMHAEAMLCEKYLSFKELNFSTFEGDALKGKNLVSLTDSIQVFPFMSECRVIKVTDFYPSESDYKTYLQSSFENMPESTMLIIVNQTSKKGCANLKTKKCITYVDCSKADEETVTKWIFITFKRAGIYCEVGLCSLIAQYCLCNMARVAVETRKLIEYKGEGTLTQEEIDSLVYKDAEYRIYEMTNAISLKNHSLFTDIVTDLKRKGVDEIAILNNLYYYFRTLYTIASSKESNARLAELLKQKEFAVKKQREAVARIGNEKILHMLTLLHELLSDVKCGELNAPYALMRAENEIFFS